MIKRHLKIGDYNTAADGLWTLKSWELGEPTPVTNFIDVPGRIKGPLDASTVLTDGAVVYDPRPLAATLESSEGKRLEREARISEMINRLHGRREKIILPDDPTHYVVGRVSVKRLYNDMAHGSVEVTATCEPWKYSTEETVATLAATTTTTTATLINQGVMPIVPMLTVTGGDVNLAFGAASWALSAGTYQLPDLCLTTGEHLVTYSGGGALTFTYREAVLR